MVVLDLERERGEKGMLGAQVKEVEGRVVSLVMAEIICEE